MFKTNVKIAWRNLVKNKVYTLINIIGLSAGMATAILIGLWIWNEASFNKYNPHYKRVAQVLQNQVLNDNVVTWDGMPYPLAEALRKNYESDFENVTVSSGAYDQAVGIGDKRLNVKGIYLEPQAVDMFAFSMLSGGNKQLVEPSSIIISQSASKAWFGSEDAVGKIMQIDTVNVTVSGVYKDMPANSTMADILFVAPWQFRMIHDNWLKNLGDPWGNNSFNVFVQLAANADMQRVSAKIKNVKLDNIRPEERTAKPALFLQPMSRMYLYSEFKNGVNTGGRIEFVWLFGIIGMFVLLLACINFMNLSTARSEKRAKEVGIRKTVGSLRSQLIAQFFVESLLVAFFAFIVSILWVQLSLPFFNALAGKQLAILWGNPIFWLAAIGFTLITGLIAGSYPALYLSSFKPVKVLKGNFHVGRLASVPRKVLVVVQFTVSIILIIGTIVVFRQVQFAGNRPVGYNRSGLVTVYTGGGAVHAHFDAIKSELVSSGAITAMAESANPLTDVWRTNGGFTWQGKDPSLSVLFPTNGVSYDYGKMIGWKISAGRDFSPAFSGDSAAFILNETAVKYMSLKNPVGQTIRWSDGVAFNVIGVVKDVVMESPYEPVRPSFYFLARRAGILTLKLNPQRSAQASIETIENVLKKYNPQVPFSYRFVDDAYGQKFENEKRIGKLSITFATLAILISCLGLFAMASFVAEQRLKEIGIRKVLGATLLNVWQLLSKEFIMLVAISLLVAMPVGWYFMHQWLQNYTYNAGIAWWVFPVTGVVALVITLCTVSYQAIKAALSNPVKALRE